MVSATVEDLTEHPTSVISSLEAGEIVELVKAGKRIALLLPSTETSAPAPTPDFVSRMKQHYREPVGGASAQELVDFMRGDPS